MQNLRVFCLILLVLMTDGLGLDGSLGWGLSRSGFSSRLSSRFLRSRRSLSSRGSFSRSLSRGGFSSRGDLGWDRFSWCRFCSRGLGGSSFGNRGSLSSWRLGCGCFCGSLLWSGQIDGWGNLL
jgi:hypothetical protein